MKEVSNSNRKPNHLLGEKSPYLLEHAYNPVDWYPWGEEPFKKAKTENKPIFLSIGYSSCHWCHVFRRESLEDPEIAELLNENFVSIKVDREERPDIDEVYMKSLIAMTGSGGWPLNVFLTPSLEPFYGGTYFPPLTRYGMPSFSNVLRSISKAWKSDRKRIAESASQMKSSLQDLYDFKKSSETRIDRSPISDCYEGLASSFDEEYGGFGSAPKFPSPSNLFFLLRYFCDKKDANLSLAMATKTLDSMMRGGIYDQVGGGFHRYSTDRYWLVPHFEKMLYDNALLVAAYSEAYLVTRNEEYARIVRETIDWALREMKSETGGFYSAVDADSPEGEGIFYTWTLEEVYNALASAGFDSDEIKAVSKYFSVTNEGNFEEGRSILTAKSSHIAAKDLGLTSQVLEDLVKKAKKAMLEVRQNRSRPLVDDKVLSGWNGLMLSALSKAYDALGDERFLSAAEGCANFVLGKLSMPGEKGDVRLLRRFRQGESKGGAVLEDYAFLVNGLLDLYEADFDPKYLENAVAIAKRMLEDYYDEKDGGFFQTAGDSSDLIVRPKDAFDGALPSGNSLAVLVCLRLAEITADQQYRKKTSETLSAFWDAIMRQPTSFTEMIVCLQYLLGRPKEIVISGQKGDELTESLMKVIRSHFLPNSVIVLADDRTAKISPLVQDRVPTPNGVSKVFVCSNFSCKLPSKTEIELEKALTD